MGGDPTRGIVTTPRFPPILVQVLASYPGALCGQAAGEYAAAISTLRVYAAWEAVPGVYLGRAFIMAGTLREAEMAVRTAIKRRTILPDVHSWLRCATGR